MLLLSQLQMIFFTLELERNHFVEIMCVENLNTFQGRIHNIISKAGAFLIKHNFTLLKGLKHLNRSKKDA